MFNCYVHGWSHIERPCSICNPIHIWTSSGTTLEAVIGISKSELDRLKAENARLREALIELSHSEVIKNDPESYEIVGEALKGEQNE